MTPLSDLVAAGRISVRAREEFEAVRLKTVAVQEMGI